MAVTMPKKISAPTTETPHEKVKPLDEPVIASPEPKRNYIEIPVPSFSYNRSSYTPILVIALAIFAFLLGMMATKIQYLEGGVKPTQNALVPTAAPGAAQPTIAPQKVEVAEGHLPVLGNKDAKVTIVEFSDFQCPFCKRFVDQTWEQLKKDYIDSGKAKLTFRHLPLSSIHPNAQKAAEASECANEQDKFWDYHDKLFATQDTWSAKAADAAAADFTSYAGELGLNTDQFSSCLSSGKYTEAITKDSTDAATAGATGTPAFFINGYILVGAQPISAFKTEIDKYLQ